MTDQADFYQTGGSLTHDAPSYVERDADRELFEALYRGEFCYVLTSRQMGKSSLMVHTTQRLREQDVHVVVMDLTAIGENLTAEQWYLGLLGVVGRRLDLEDELEQFWWEHERLGPLERWMRALREVVLPNLGVQAFRRSGVQEGLTVEPERPNARTPERLPQLVIFIDEIDTVRSLPFSTDEFFAAIRECYNRRTEDAEYRRLTFCLLGVATPSDLIRDVRRTPFNIGRRIELNDFSEVEAAPLASGLAPTDRGPVVPAKRLLRRILHWTGGHPYLTQRLCQAVADSHESRVTSHESGRSGLTTRDTRHATKLVDRLCEELFLSPRGRERDDNLLFVRDRMLRTDVDRAELLDLYGQIQAGRRVAMDDTNPLCDVLQLSGITRVRGDERRTTNDERADRWSLVVRRSSSPRLQVRNRIYERVFDRRWVLQHMPDAELRRQRTAFRRGLVRATTVSAVIVAVMAGLALTAVNQSRRADQQRHVAQEGQQTLRRNLYVAQTNMAQQAWEAGNVGRAVELLDAQRPTPPGQEDLRGFEWRYLWRLCQGDSRFTLRGHTDGVRCVAFSPDGRLLATASRDSTIKLWDMASRRERATLTGHTGGVFSVAFSTDGKLLASAGGDGAVKLWKTPGTGPHNAPLAPPAWQEVSTLKGHHDAVGSVAFSPDGRMLATASDDRTVKLWDVAHATSEASEHARELTTFPGPLLTFSRQVIHSVAFSPDGKILATGRQDGLVKLWDVATRQPLGNLSVQSIVCSVAFSPDGKSLATGDADHTVRLWDVAVPRGRPRELAAFTAFKSIVYAVAFSPDGKSLAAGSMEGTIKLWDVGSATRGSRVLAAQRTAAGAGPREASEHARERTTLKGHRDEVWSVAFSPDGKTLASASSDHTARLWDAGGASDAGGPSEERGRSGGRSPGARSGGPRPPSGGRGSEARGRAPGAGPRRESGILQGHQGRVGAVAFSPDGKILATGSSVDKTVKLWDVARARETATLRGHTQGVASVAFSPDGRILATGSGSRLAPYRPSEVKLWTVPSATSEASEHAREITTLKGHRGGIFGAAFSPDGRTLATASLDGTVKLWNVAAGELVATLRGHPGGAYGVAFSPDGRTLATCSMDGSLKLWDMVSRRERITWKGHTLQVRSVAFSPDGKTLATASFDRTVKLWDVRGALMNQVPAEIATLKGHSDRVWSAVFSPDGKTLASGSFDGSVKLWNLLTNQEVATLRGHTHRVLGVAFSPDGNLLASASADSTVRLWRAAPFAETEAAFGSRP